MKKILHITAHMGGGVGRVLSRIATYSNNNSCYRHKIILLERPEKINFIEECINNNVEVLVESDFNKIIDEALLVDIVQLEWWHHPKFIELMMFLENVAIKLIVWAHISGCNYPYISPKLPLIPHKFIFTSDFSYENPFWSKKESSLIKESCPVINSSGGFEHIIPQVKIKNKFTIGYLGTQSFSKLNVDFMKYCKSVSAYIDVNFRMVGDVLNKDTLLKEATELGIEDKFTFIDYTTDVNYEFSQMDVFGYLLNENHFGTTENVLLEAMAAELPVICLSQNAEKHIVVNNKTGFLINSIDDYVSKIKLLYENKELRKRLGKAARKHVLDKFSLKSTVDKLHEVYNEVDFCEKKHFNFREVFGDAPFQYFISGLSPMDDKLIQKAINNDFDKFKENCPIILQEENKSSIRHFYRVFPEEENFKKLINILNNK